MSEAQAEATQMASCAADMGRTLKAEGSPGYRAREAE